MSDLGIPWYLSYHHLSVGLFLEATAPLEMWDTWMGPCSPANSTQPPPCSALERKAIYLSCPGMNSPGIYVLS